MATNGLPTPRASEEPNDVPSYLRPEEDFFQNKTDNNGQFGDPYRSQPRPGGGRALHSPEPGVEYLGPDNTHRREADHRSIAQRAESIFGYPTLPLPQVAQGQPVGSNSQQSARGTSATAGLRHPTQGQPVGSNPQQSAWGASATTGSFFAAQGQPVGSNSQQPARGKSATASSLFATQRQPVGSNSQQSARGASATAGSLFAAQGQPVGSNSQQSARGAPATAGSLFAAQGQPVGSSSQQSARGASATAGSLFAAQGQPVGSNSQQSARGASAIAGSLFAAQGQPVGSDSQQSARGASAIAGSLFTAQGQPAGSDSQRSARTSATAGLRHPTRGQPTTIPSPGLNIFVPRFSESPPGTEFDINRVKGWHRCGFGRSYLLTFGMPQHPMVEMVPGSAIGNLVLQSLGESDSLTTKQNGLSIKIWNDTCQVTNVARSASSKRPIVWVELNGGLWVSRSFLQSYRLLAIDKPLGKASVNGMIMKFVTNRARLYHQAGFPAEAQKYHNEFLNIFTSKTPPRHEQGDDSQDGPHLGGSQNLPAPRGNRRTRANRAVQPRENDAHDPPPVNTSRTNTLGLI